MGGFPASHVWLPGGATVWLYLLLIAGLWINTFRLPRVLNIHLPTIFGAHQRTNSFHASSYPCEGLFSSPFSWWVNHWTPRRADSPQELRLVEKRSGWLGKGRWKHMCHDVPVNVLAFQIGLAPENRELNSNIHWKNGIQIHWIFERCHVSRYQTHISPGLVWDMPGLRTILDPSDHPSTIHHHHHNNNNNDNGPPF